MTTNKLLLIMLFMFFACTKDEASLAVIELSNGDIVVAGSGAFLEGGYGGFPTITRLSFSNTVTAQ